MSSIKPKSDSIHIREVWADNLAEEFRLIKKIVGDYPYIAIDTEFPGVVLKPITGNFETSSEDCYRSLKANVDIMKPIQLGLTFFDEEGNLPTCGTCKLCIWQFNFREFNARHDVYASESIELLKQSGIDFEKNSEKGVDTERFRQHMVWSGVLGNSNLNWVTFHGSYDFGYLLKILTRRNLPETQKEFFFLMNLYFPTIYDIKHVIRYCNGLYGGLNKLAELLGLERIGTSHQAGSDSLLTSLAFQKLKALYFNFSEMDDYAGVLYGLDEPWD